MSLNGPVTMIYRCKNQSILTQTRHKTAFIQKTYIPALRDNLLRGAPCPTPAIHKFSDAYKRCMQSMYVS